MKAPTLKSLTPTSNQLRHPRGWARSGGPGPAGPSSPKLSQEFPCALGRGRGLRPPRPDRRSKVAGREARRHPAPRCPERGDPSSQRAGLRVPRQLPTPPRAGPGSWRRERHRPPTVSAARPARVPAADVGGAPQVGASAGPSARPALTLRSAVAQLPPSRSSRPPRCGSGASPARRPHSRRRGRSVRVPGSLGAPAHLALAQPGRARVCLDHTPRLPAPQELPAFSLLSSRILSRKHTGRGSFGPSEAFSLQKRPPPAHLVFIRAWREIRPGSRRIPKKFLHGEKEGCTGIVREPKHSLYEGL